MFHFDCNACTRANLVAWLTSTLAITKIVNFAQMNWNRLVKNTTGICVLRSKEISLEKKITWMRKKWNWISRQKKEEKEVPNAKIESCSLFNKLGARLQFPLLIGIKSILIAFFRCFFSFVEYFIQFSHQYVQCTHAAMQLTSLALKCAKFLCDATTRCVDLLLK